MSRKGLKNRTANGPRREKSQKPRPGKHPQGAPRNILEGIISISSKGVGYVRTDPKDEDIEIESRFLNTALHGDRVKVLLFPKKSRPPARLPGRSSQSGGARAGGRITGEVTEILVRAKPGFAGTLEAEGEEYFLVPQDTRMYADILIPREKLGGGKVGDKVFAVITRWSDPRKSPEGEVTEVLGQPNENNAEMRAIALERGFSARFPEAVEREAAALKTKGLTEAGLSSRRDFRATTTFTIDPEDAKDFDDAISFKFLPRGLYEIGVHIADVSHFVTPGSELDKEAAKRGTSVYLVDRTIPMLPETLSNDLCSLNPNEDKLTMSAVFVLDENARVHSEWFGKTVINSNKRFTYESAQEILDKKDGPYFKELDILNRLAKKLLKARQEKGAISMEQEEVKFVLDEKGVPLRVYKKVRGDTHRLIEEFMLLCNKHVAKFVIDREKRMNKEHVFVYRVHDVPDREKISDLVYFLQSVGYELKLEDGQINPKELNRLLTSLEGKTEKDMIQTAVVRSMAKAVYSTDNIGHYGLAFDYYAHFTSPIRRYPDVLAHRLLQNYLRGREVSQKEFRDYDTLCNYSSQREREAADAERASVKYKQVEYMSKRVGMVFDGIISGVTEWGLYVEEKETKCEGLVSVRALSDDFYRFDEKHYRLVGERARKKYTLGDKVRFKVLKADLTRRTLDYGFV